MSNLCFSTEKQIERLKPSASTDAQRASSSPLPQLSCAGFEGQCPGPVGHYPVPSLQLNAQAGRVWPLNVKWPAALGTNGTRTYQGQTHALAHRCSRRAVAPSGLEFS
jgi:hypothetical protein